MKPFLPQFNPRPTAKAAPAPATAAAPRTLDSLVTETDLVTLQAAIGLKSNRLITRTTGDLLIHDFRNQLQSGRPLTLRDLAEALSTQKIETMLQAVIRQEHMREMKNPTDQSVHSRADPLLLQTDLISYATPVFTAMQECLQLWTRGPAASVRR